MAGSFTLPTVLANLAAGNEALSLIDGDFNAVANPLLALGTFSNYYADAGAANAYVVTVSSPQTVAQTAGLAIQFLAANANTGASTLQINALAVKNITHIDGSALVAGDIPAASLVSVIYDGTQYQLQSKGKASALEGVTYLTGTAGTNTITATAAPTFAAYAAGQKFAFLPAVTNTGATTLNIGGLGAKSIFWNGAAVVGGELIASVPVLVMYDGTQFQIIGSASMLQFKGTPTANRVPYAVGASSLLQDSANLTFNGSTLTLTGSVAATSTAATHVLTGGTNGAESLDINNGGNATPFGINLRFTAAAPNDTTEWFLKCFDNAASRCFIYSNGNLQNTLNSYGAISDRKLKQDMELAGSQWEDVKALARITTKYRLKADPKGPKLLGFVADQVKPISPGLVYSTPDVEHYEEEVDGEVVKKMRQLGTTTDGVNYSIAYMKAFKALGEALERIEALEAKIGT